MIKENLTRILLGTTLLIGSSSLEHVSRANDYAGIPGTRIEVPLKYENKVVKTVPLILSTARSVIDSSYIGATIRVESDGNPEAVSHSGAVGNMQIMPSTWQEYCKDIPFNKKFNRERKIECGTRYLNWVVDYIREKHPEWGLLSFNEKRNLVAAAYHGGPTKLKDLAWNLEEMPDPTKHYVEKIRNKFDEIISI